MSEPDIVVNQLVKEFDHGRIRALTGLDLEVAAGEFVAVTGPSGCGKSTLIHLLAALDEPTSGSIAVHGHLLPSSPRQLDHYRRHAVGLVFQLHNLLPNLTALQNVEIAMMGTGMTRRAERERGLQLLDEVGLAARTTSRPAEMSGGERQRVAIARALANNPPLLLADEPTGSLDSEASAGVLAFLQSLRIERNMTILMVTHDPRAAASADRTVRLRDGRVHTEAVEALK
ncbi:MAG: ABC transporter ATP-binding protein [Ilumatobacteraceae bacterium]